MPTVLLPPTLVPMLLLPPTDVPTELVVPAQEPPASPRYVAQDESSAPATTVRQFVALSPVSLGQHDARLMQLVPPPVVLDEPFPDELLLLQACAVMPRPIAVIPPSIHAILTNFIR